MNINAWACCLVFDRRIHVVLINPEASYADLDDTIFPLHHSLLARAFRALPGLEVFNSVVNPTKKLLEAANVHTSLRHVLVKPSPHLLGDGSTPAYTSELGADLESHLAGKLLFDRLEHPHVYGRSYLEARVSARQEHHQSDNYTDLKAEDYFPLIKLGARILQLHVDVLKDPISDLLESPLPGLRELSLGFVYGGPWNATPGGVHLTDNLIPLLNSIIELHPEMDQITFRGGFWKTNYGGASGGLQRGGFEWHGRCFPLLSNALNKVGLRAEGEIASICLYICEYTITHSDNTRPDLGMASWEEQWEISSVTIMLDCSMPDSVQMLASVLSTMQNVRNVNIQHEGWNAPLPLSVLNQVLAQIYFRIFVVLKLYYSGKAARPSQLRYISQARASVAYQSHPEARRLSRRTRTQILLRYIRPQSEKRNTCSTKRHVESRRRERMFYGMDAC